MTKISAEVDALIKDLNSKQAAVKYKAAKTLSRMSEENPEILYPYFETFVKLLDGTNNILKWNAIDIIGNLAAADTEDKFSSLFGKYYGLLVSGSLITAAHVVESSPVIIKYKPELENQITGTLFSVEFVPLPTAECRDILRGKVITAFNKYAKTSKNKNLMLGFAGRLVNKSGIRPATQKKAAAFLKKYQK